MKEIVRAKAASSDAPLTEELVAKHPLYLQLQDKMTKALDTQKSEYETKLKDKDSEVEQRETMSFVEKELRRVYKECNPVIPEGVPGQTQERLFLKNILESYKWQLDGTGDKARIIPIDIKTGKPLVDDHERRTEFTDLV